MRTLTAPERHVVKAAHEAAADVGLTLDGGLLVDRYGVVWSVGEWATLTTARIAATWNEEDHPRDAKGQFGGGDGGGTKDGDEKTSAVAVGDTVQGVRLHGTEIVGEIAKFNPAGDKAYLINIKQPNPQGLESAWVPADKLTDYEEPEPVESTPGSGFVPPEILPTIDDDELEEHLMTEFNAEGYSGGSTGGEWFVDPDSGDRYLYKEPDGSMYAHEGTNELIGSRILDEVDLIHGDVRGAGDNPDGNFPIVSSDVNDLEGIQVLDNWGNTGGFNRNEGTDSPQFEDAIRLSMFDTVVQNQDGHGGNFLKVLDGDGMTRIAPIDNSLILGGRGDGDDYGNVGFPDPAPMEQFDQYNGTRQAIAAGIGETYGVPRETVERVYDETVGQLRAGVEAVDSPAFLDRLPQQQQQWVMNEAVPYMKSQVDALVTYRDKNITSIAGEPVPDYGDRFRGGIEHDYFGNTVRRDVYGNTIPPGHI